MKKLILTLSLFAILASCSTLNKSVPLGGTEHKITEAYAQYRAGQVSDVQYDLDFDLSEKKATYKGVSRISFIPLHNKQDLRIDFYRGKVLGIKANGQDIQYKYNETYIQIPAKHITGERVKLEITFSHPYSQSGRGFHRFVDPKDKRTYVYTNLEPYDANQVFPCFDQPDLKASYKMNVVAPKSWSVVTSVRESSVKTKGSTKIWQFPKSERFSTYIWSLHAGDYYVWSDAKFRYPLRLFVRKSLKKYVKPQQWFRYTRAGFDYFDKYFDYPYPYKKYDQVIAPEFFSGAMENVAAVTFSERFVSKGEKSRQSKRSLAIVIHHEMAHMWFGDLVTMKWWNDLWLNESFATYMSQKSTYSSTEFKEVWRKFMGRKSGAIWEDELPTTHPIEGNVADTHQARTNFDGISYGKGASVLKQMNFLIGEKAFQKGLQSYFKKYDHSNTELKDFMASLQSATDSDLTSWQKQWLQTAGVNTMAPQWSCEKDSLKELSITQSYKKGFAHTRSHKIQVALVYKKKQQLSINKIDALLDKKTNPISLGKNTPCPIAVIPNYNDYGYFKTKLDKKSLANAREILSAQNENFLKQMYWSSLWQMVRDGQYSVVKYAQLLQNHFPNETDQLIVQFLSYKVSSIDYYLPKGTEKQKAFRKNYITSMESQLWKKLLGAKAKSELQKILFNSFVGVARSPKSQKIVLSLLSGRKKLRGLKIDQDKRWSLISALSVSGNKKTESLIAKELKRDSSTKGKKSAMVARAIFPSLSVKKKWYTQLTNSNDASNFDEFRRLTRTLFPYTQFDLQKKFTEDFYKDLSRLESSLNAHFARSFATLAPVECDPQLRSKAENFLKKNQKFRPGTQKSLKVSISESKRCEMIRQKASL